MEMEKPPSWRLPDGVSSSLWDYIQSDEVSDGYDQRLAGSLLFQQDAAFVREFCQPPGRLIDLGCGTGRMLTECARLGHRVLGVDLSQGMLKQAHERGVRDNLSFELLNANLTRMECIAEASFDYAICLFSTLGMIGGDRCRRDVLAHAHRMLKPGGKFVVHVHNRWFSCWDVAGRRWLIKDIWRRFRKHPLAGDRPMPAHQGVAGLALHHFGRREIIQLLESVGFRILEIRPVGLTGEKALPSAWFFPRLRAYGYLLAAERVAR